MKIEDQDKLVNYFTNYPTDRAFLSFHDIELTYSDVLQLCSEFKVSYPEIINKNCAVVSKDRETLAMFLPALDSICKTIFLQPSDDELLNVDLYDLVSIEYVIYLESHSVSSIKKIIRSNLLNNGSIGNEKYILATSGTTGEPKLVGYTLEALTSTTSKNFGRGQEFTWGLTYDLNRFAGLQVFFQAIVAGSKLVVASKQDTIDMQIKLYVERQVNCVSATPSYWRKILMSPSHKSIPLKRITLGGEISNSSILTTLSSSYPNASIIHIYASTEAGVGFTVKDCKEGFPIEFLQIESLNIFRLKVSNGLLWIKSAFGSNSVIKGELEIDDEGFINTGDLVDVRGDRVLFLGRESGSINVGGNKVMPEKVESVLEESPYVKMAMVYGKKNPMLGALVTTELVLTELGRSITKNELKNELLAYCRSRLQAFEIPVLFNHVDNIEINSTGKKIRKR